MTSAKADPTFRHAPLIGLAIDVALRLRDPKGKKDVGKGYVDELKDVVREYYLSAVVPSKAVPPRQVVTAFTDFLGATVTSEMATSTYLPAFEKALNRFAEPALVILEGFLAAVPEVVQGDVALQQRLAPAVLASAKSTSAPTRAAVVRLFATLYASGDEATLLPIAEQVYTPIRQGKTTSADHRTTLYTLFAAFPPSAKLSPEISSTVLGALAKETTEHTVVAMSRALSVHLPQALLADAAVPAPHAAALVKMMADTKPVLRRLAQVMVGNVFWALRQADAEATEAEKAFATALWPGFEASLKTVTTSMLNSPSGPLEGYVAVAVLKSRAHKWQVKKIGEREENTWSFVLPVVHDR